MADLVTSKILWNSVVSTDNAKFMTIDTKNVYLSTPLDQNEYTKMPIALIPDHFIDQCNL